MVEHDFVEGSLVISLNAPFGGGTGSGNHEGQDAESRTASIEKLFKDLEYIKQDSSFDLRRELGDFSHGWGHHFDDRWKQIYQNIETANIF